MRGAWGSIEKLGSMDGRGMGELLVVGEVGLSMGKCGRSGEMCWSVGGDKGRCGKMCWGCEEVWQVCWSVGKYGEVWGMQYATFRRDRFDLRRLAVTDSSLRRLDVGTS